MNSSSRDEIQIALSGTADWIPRCIRTYLNIYYSVPWVSELSEFLAISHNFVSYLNMYVNIYLALMVLKC